MNILQTLTKQEERLITKVQYKKGTTIFREGDICEHLSIVLDGIIEVTSYTNSGNEIIYNSVSKNQMFGNNLIFSSSPFYKGDVISKENALVAHIKKEDILFLLKNNEAFLMSYLRYGSDFSKNLNEKIKILSLPSAEEKILYLLMVNNDTVFYSSITNLAKTLFLTREATSRAISKLVKSGKIAKGNKRLIFK